MPCNGLRCISTYRVLIPMTHLAPGSSASTLWESQQELPLLMSKTFAQWETLRITASRWPTKQLPGWAIWASRLLPGKHVHPANNPVLGQASWLTQMGMRYVSLHRKKSGIKPSPLCNPFKLIWTKGDPSLLNF